MLTKIIYNSPELDAAGRVEMIKFPRNQHRN